MIPVVTIFLFSHIHSYVVFCLGNKTYEQYNAMGRHVDRRLEELGANRIFQRGEGDDDGKWVWLCNHMT